MGIASKYNKGGVAFIAKPEENTGYCKLKDLVECEGWTPDTAYTIGALYINDKGNYGPEAVAYITAPFKALVNFPAHMTETVKEMRKDPEAVKAINEGHLGFNVYTYTKDSRSGYSVNFVDL